MARPDRGRGLPAALRLSNAGVVYALIAIVGVLTLVSAQTGRTSYLSGTNVVNLLDQSSLVGILAIFTTMVLISGNFDLSIASVAAFSAALALRLMADQGLVVAIVAALLAGTVLGLINGLIVQYVGVNAFIVTLGTMTAVRALVLIITDGRTITVTDDAARQSLMKLETGYWGADFGWPILAAALIVAGIVFVVREGKSRPRGYVLAAAGVALVAFTLVAGPAIRLSKPTWYLIAIAAVTWAVLRFTVVGRRLYAVGGNAEAARLSGINVNRYRVGAFALNGLAASFIGILYAARLVAINPTGLSGLELTVIAAAILGGTSLFGGQGSVLLSIVGALILFTLANGFNVLDLGANYQGLIEGVVVIVAAGMYTVATRRRQTRAKRGTRPEEPAAVPQPAASP